MSTQLGLNFDFYKTGQSVVGSSRTLARVDKVILGPIQVDGKPDEDFRKNGLWASVGAIRYTLMYTTEVVPNQNATIARPYNSNNTQYPVIGEIVELVYGPSDKLNDDSLDKELYYKNPVNLWNSVHHNAFPNFLNLATRNDNLNVSYQDTTNGIAPAPSTSSQTPSLGIPEKPNIKNLQPLPGDITMQGRWGQSIRFGSTTKGSAIKTPWSSAGTDGDPIMIIRNGQTDAKASDPWTTLVEDINSDPASIYLCSGQAIYIQDLNNFKLDSFTINSKVPEASIQPLKRPLVSTDAVSPVSQSQLQLQSAQASTQINIPSVVPQTKVAVSYAVTGSPIQTTTAQGFVGPLPDTGSNTTISVTTTTVLPTGQISSSTVNVPYDPFGIGKLGSTATSALTSLPVAPSIASSPTSSNPVAAGGTQVETGAELEVIVAEESLDKLGFEIDNSGNPAIIEQDDVPDTPSPINNTVSGNGLVQNDGTLGDLYYYPSAIFNQGDPKWGSNFGGGYSLKKAGCCYTSFSMMATHYKKDSKYTPEWFWNNAKKSTVVYWGDMAKAVGLRSSGGVNATTTAAIDARLSRGPVMIEWDNTNKGSKTKYAGLYTKKHHWMLVTGKNKNGTYTIFNPSGAVIYRNQTQAQIEAGLIRISYML